MHSWQALRYQGKENHLTTCVDEAEGETCQLYSLMIFKFFCLFHTFKEHIISAAPFPF